MRYKKKWRELLNTTLKHGFAECGWKKAVISSGQDTGLDVTEIRTWERTEARALLILVAGLDGNAILKGNSWGSAQLVDQHRDDPIIYQGSSSTPLTTLQLEILPGTSAVERKRWESGQSSENKNMERALWGNTKITRLYSAFKSAETR